MTRARNQNKRPSSGVAREKHIEKGDPSEEKATALNAPLRVPSRGDHFKSQKLAGPHRKRHTPSRAIVEQGDRLP